jgi:hypothetical protein
MNPTRTIRSSHPRRSWWTARALGTIALAVAMSACAVTQRMKPKLNENQCVFLAPNVCSMLTPNKESNRAGLGYVAPDVDWAQYTGAIVTPVAVYGDADKKPPGAEVQALADYAHAAMVKALGKELAIVTEPAKGVLKIQLALTNASAAVPVLRTVSMIVPQARALATLKYIATGSYAFVGGAQGEIMVTDSLTGQLLAAGVDRRVGGGSVETAAQWQWGDAENIMDKWAEMTATRIASLRGGTAAN